MMMQRLRSKEGVSLPQTTTSSTASFSTTTTTTTTTIPYEHQRKRIRTTPSILSLRNLVLFCSIVVVVLFMTFSFQMVSHSSSIKNNYDKESSSSLSSLFTTIPKTIRYSSSVQSQQPQQQQPSTLQNSSTTDTLTTTITTTTPTITIAYVVTITGCGTYNNITKAPPFPIAEGAAVLQHSIHRQHYFSTNDNNNNSTTTTTTKGRRKSQYDYQMYALYHPDAYICAQTLQPLGYQLLERNIPVSIDQIQGEFLRTHIAKNGCCGEKELLKLEAYTLIQHPIVVLLDLDTLLLQPLDVLFDILLLSSPSMNQTQLQSQLQQQQQSSSLSSTFLTTQQFQHLFMTNTTTIQNTSQQQYKIPTNLQVMHTLDYAMVQPHRTIKPFQGGFVLLKPNYTVYEEFVQIIQQGDFRQPSGWGGQTGTFWGGQTFQGIMPYYYHILHPHQSMELNWCTFNNMASPSKNQGIVEDQPHGTCFTGTKDCEDCRTRDIANITFIHYTVCEKPWLCKRHAENSLPNRLCRQFHHVWFRERSWMEQSWGRSGYGTGTFDHEHFYGYCTSFGQKGYQLIQTPYGG